MLFKKRDAWARPLAEYDVDHGAARQRRRASRSARSRNASRAARCARRSGRGDAAPDLAGRGASAPLPAKLEPQLATLVAAPPARRLDRRDQVRRLPAAGAHRQAARRGSSPAAATTGPTRCSRSPPRSRRSASRSAWLDGEIVVHGRGRPARLQRAAERVRQRARARRSSTSSSTCRSTTATTCARCRCARAARCSQQLLRASASDRVRFSQPLSRRRRRRCSRRRCSMRLEGVIAKRADAPYVSRARETWLKLKCPRARSSWSCGFTDRSGARARGRQPAARLHDATASCATPATSAPAGTRRTRRDLHATLVALEVDEAAVRRRHGQARALVAGAPQAASAGSSRAGRRGRVRRVDARRPRPPRRLPGAAHATSRRARSRARVAAAGAPGAAAAPARPSVRASRSANPERVIDPRPASPRSTWCATTRASPSGCCRT